MPESLDLPPLTHLAHSLDLSLEACSALARCSGFEATAAALDLATEALLLDLSRAVHGASSVTDTTD
jgi:hypothetical protein